MLCNYRKLPCLFTALWCTCFFNLDCKLTLCIWNLTIQDELWNFFKPASFTWQEKWFKFLSAQYSKHNYFWYDWSILISLKIFGMAILLLEYNILFVLFGMQETSCHLSFRVWPLDQGLQKMVATDLNCSNLSKPLLLCSGYSILAVINFLVEWHLLMSITNLYLSVFQF